jgi:hypothetical protein
MVTETETLRSATRRQRGLRPDLNDNYLISSRLMTLPSDSWLLTSNF